MSLYLTVPLLAIALFLLLISTLHPCGTLFGTLEIIIRALNLHDTSWEDVTPEGKYCLLRGATVAYYPKHLSSYYHGAKALWLAERSRYRTTWQASESYQFEREAAQFLGVKHLYYVSTGTAALEVMMQVLGIGPGDEVIIPTSTWIATASSITVNGAIPVLAEIDESLGINPQTLESYITPRTKAVLAVHLQGSACNLTGLRDVVRQRGLLLLEDIAQSFGASIHGKMIGTFGVAGITSVGPTKPYNTGGQGGLVWTDDDDLAERMQWAIENRIALVGGPEGLPKYRESFGPAGGGAAGERRARFVGHGFRAPSEWHAAYARAELAELPGVLKKMQGLRLELIAAMKPEYRQYLQWQEDEAGDRSYTVKLILKNASHKVPLSQHLWAYGIWIDSNPFNQFFMPWCATIMKKVSYHESGFPWVTKDMQAPDKPDNYNASVAIVQRTVKLGLSYHNTPPMVRWMAAKLNEGLDSLP